MKKLPLFLLLMSLLCFVSAQAQEPGVSLQELTINDGLTQGHVLAIAQDHQGFMWMATAGGLNRYDGYSFRVYQYDPHDPGSFQGSNFSDLLIRQNGSIWVGSSHNQISYYDRDNDGWKHCKQVGHSQMQTNNSGRLKLTEDQAGNLWAKNRSHQLYQVELENDTLITATEVLLPGTIIHQEAKSFQVMALAEGGLLATCFDTLVWVDSRSKPVEVKAYPPFAHFVKRYGRKQLIAMHQDKEGDLWLGGRDAVYRYRASLQQFERYPLEPHDFEVVNLLHVDQAGYLWIRKGDNFLRVAVKDLVAEERPATQWVCANAQSVFEDKSGIVWIGTDGFGVRKFVPQLQEFQHLLPGKVIYQMELLQPNQLWTTGTVYNLSSGLDSTIEFDGWTGKELRLRTSVVQETHPGVVWFSVPDPLKTNDYELLRLYRLDLWKESKAYFDYQLPSHLAPSLRNNFTFSDREDNLWLANSKFLLRFDPQSQSFDTPIEFDFKPSEEDAERYFTHFFQGRNGQLWIASHEGLLNVGLDHGSYQRFLEEDGLSSNKILTIHEDEEGILWVGTKGGGLNRFDPETGSVRIFSVQDGLPDNVVYGILEDHQQRLWLSTNRGLSCFDKQQETFRNFNQGHGLQSDEFNTGSYMQSKDGRCWFGGMNGITVFDPGSISINSNRPKVVLTGLRLHNKPVVVGDSNEVLPVAINMLSHLELRYDQNMVTFTFAALDFSLPEKNRFAYRLEGLNEEWIQAVHEPQATFTNLDPGNYRLRVKAANNDGVWGDSELSLTLVILPPWWKTVWAYLAYAFTGLLLFWLLVQAWLRRMKLKNQLFLEEQEAARLRELDLFKQRFFANITHELKTPVTLIAGPVSQLLEVWTENADREKLQTIFRNSEHLLNLVNQLLDIARLEEGAMVSELRQGDLLTYTRELLANLSPLAESKQISLRLEASIEAPRARLDFTAYDKILSNLVGNALKFTPEGGQVAVCLYSDIASQLTLEVRDTGRGIPKEALPHLFDRFFQVEEEPHRSAGGTGIGLSLTKELVQVLEGRIEVESELGKGTIFKVHLPFEQHIAAPRAVTLLGAEVELPLPTTSDPSAEKGSVLIVEDNADLRQLISETLVTDFELLTATNGREGLTLAHEHMPDIILLDLMMPEMDGLELLQHLRKDVYTSHIPVLMLTARSSTEVRIACFEAGADAYLAKPFHPRELLARLRQVQRTRRQLQQLFSLPENLEETTSNGASELEREFLAKIKKLTLEGMEKSQFGAEDLAAAMGMSRPHLYRKIKALTDQSISQYTRSIRLFHSKSLLKDGRYNVSEVAYSTGFSSSTYFSQCFKEEFGLSPSDYQKGTV